MNLKTKAKYPTKKTINLAMKEEYAGNAQLLVAGAVIIGLVCILVTKFGVYDQFARLAKAESEYFKVHEQKMEMEQYLDDYDQVLLDYRTWSRDWMAENEHYVTIERTKLLDLLEQYVSPYGTLYHVDITENRIGVQLGDLSLQQLSAMMEKLEEHPLVSHSELNTATTEEKHTNEKVDFVLTIQLQSEEEGDKE